MLEKLFHIDSRQRLLAGPMGPHLEALSSKLAELGYCDSQARKVFARRSVGRLTGGARSYASRS